MKKLTTSPSAGPVNQGGAQRCFSPASCKAVSNRHREARPKKSGCFTASLLMLLGVVGMSANSQAQQSSWPDRPIRVVVAAAPASAADLTMRIVGQEMQKLLGQGVVVDTKPGASGLIAVNEVMRAAPDGYTLLMGNANSNALLPALQPGKLAVDLRKALIPISMLSDAPALLLASKADFPPESLADMVSYVRERPDELFYTSSGVGTHGHVSMLILSDAAGLHLNHVPAPSNSQAGAMLASGEVKLGFATMATAVPLVQGGRFKPLAATGLSRHAVLPEVPTFLEAGYAAVSFGVWQGLFAPAGVPQELVDKLFKTIQKAMAQPETIEALERANLVPLVSTSPAAFAEFVDAEITKFRQIGEDNQLPIQ